MEDALILTLGHGASAILIIQGKIISGYQLERLTGVKGDSRFPIACIEEIKSDYDLTDGIPILVSHWHPSGLVDGMTKKHWNPKYLSRMFPNSPITSTNTYTTHHDTHAYSALAYNHSSVNGDFIMVADGFGTLGEVLSIYVNINGTPKLVKRAFGFGGSLGLLYQYATDYVGWKQNQDEWKLNACANQCDEFKKPSIYDAAVKFAQEIFDKQMDRDVGRFDDPVTNLGALSYAHKEVVSELSNWFASSDKAGIAYFLQIVVTSVTKTWLHVLNIRRCTFVGGCFLNVQLNGSLVDHLDMISIMPLSGDEGAGLGIYKFFNPDFIIPDDLSWGRRKIKQDLEPKRSVLYTENFPDLVEEFLAKDYIVNVIRSTMEFGPRAYCNTSTLAKPTEKNRAYINHLNQRTEHMPMCPVMTLYQFEDLFEKKSGIRRSVEHMIVALPWKQSKYPGVEYRTAEGQITGRPQVVDSDHWMHELLGRQGPLINTSFNNHGHPIVFTLDQILHAHAFMKAHDSESRVVTVIDISETNQSAPET